ncbi:MAG TPA: ATP-binding protein [Lacunisphaera sp.]|nr:ATP-binding protein [Lacunisphaera sp.]
MKQWWLRRSLRFRLAAWYALGGTLLLAGFTSTIYFFVAYHMGQPLDHKLQQDLAQVRKNLHIDADGQVRWRDRVVQNGEAWPAGNPWFELWDESGGLVRRFWPFTDSRLERLPASPAPGRETISVFNVAEDVRLRVLSVPFEGEGGRPGWMLRVMSLHEPSVNALRALLFIIAVALPVVIIILVVGGYAITHHWLKPLDLMVAEAHQITAENLSRRLPVENPHDEIGRLSRVFNTTLSRLEDSFVTLDRFVADAAHELLTPLTTLRSVGEVGLRTSRSAEEYREIVGSMLEESLRLQLLVEKLLQLARAEGGASIVERERVRLDSLARHCADDANILAEEKRQTIVVEAGEIETETDPLLLRQALQNLVDNAIKYSPEGATIVIRVAAEEANWTITVVDNGPGIQPEHLARLTDRFFRADSSRGRPGGFGLGLAITKAYLRVLGGELHCQGSPGHGTTFTIALPRHSPAAASGLMTGQHAEVS